ncbi:MAG: hypothetical protein KBB64_01895 [Bacteroidia bacterium]|jgi:hypothetical protein|nr:hypothetical protein [Bacteroidia bacterium]
MKELSKEESLSIITSMIEATKKDLQDNGSWYLLWGWLVFIACAIHYSLMKVGYEHPYYAWILMPVGGVISVVKGIREEKQQRVKTFVDDFMRYVLIAFLVCMLMVLFNSGVLKLTTYPLLMMVYGVWLFLSGGALSFRPLLIGGIINWALAVIGFYVGFETQLLLLAAAVMFGYIIPGYMLRSRYNKASRENVTSFA